MADETTTPIPEAPVKGDAKPKRDFKKEQKPIEELYDLSQPIPHVSWTRKEPIGSLTRMGLRLDKAKALQCFAMWAKALCI